MARRRLARSLGSALVVVVIAGLAISSQAWAGTPPNVLDKNVFGAVVASPRIHNLFWDSNWNADNPGFSIASIDNFTATLTATGGYLSRLSQYGVGKATFSSASVPNGFCGPSRAPSSVTEAAIATFLLCELGAPLFSGAPGPAPGIPVSNDLYVLYLPTNTSLTGTFTIPGFTVLGKTFPPIPLGTPSCPAPTGFGAEHYIFPTPLTFIQLAIVPTRCGLANLTSGTSHEIVEAASDAVPLAGWVDDSLPFPANCVTASNSNFTPQSYRFCAGEAGDLCSTGGSQIRPAISAQPASAAIATAFGARSVATYWSNADNGCVAGTPVGTFRLAPKRATAHTGRAIVLKLRWLAPHLWRDLKRIDLELIDGRRVIGAVSFHGNRTLSLGGVTGVPGTNRVLTRGQLSLLLAQSSVRTSGAKGKTVTIQFALQFARSLVGHKLAIKLDGADKHGATQPYLAGGTVSVTP
jgi:hypothetical protein